MKMKKLPIILACTLLMFVLVPSLHASPPAPAAQVDLAQIFAPASSTATAGPADPTKMAPSDLFLPAPKLASCTVKVCLEGCNDCPFGHTNYCISTVTCICGCR
jgi:hypothetical protein